VNIVDRKICLNLNANWQAIGIRTVQQAFISMNGGDSENPPVKALDITYPLKENGEYDFDTMPYMTPCSWLEWIALPIREYDLVLNTAKYKIRVPSIIISVNYHKVPKKRFKPNKTTLYNMQGGRDGYTNEPISFNSSNIEHINPRSQGGKDVFENLLIIKKTLNSKRGNRPLAELGLSPKFHHKEPAPIPVSFIFNKNAHLDWRWFLH
jgi:5-methylcytosine-specific restriction endonuclease McrA